MLERDLRTRLAFFDKKRALPAERPPRLQQSARDELLAALGGMLHGSGATRYLKIEEAVEPSLFPGSPADCVSDEAWFRLSGKSAPAGNHWVVLDTETTGLQTGAGTLVFLVGLLHWRDDGAQLVQYFIPEPAGESDMLRDLWRELESADALVSFNGLAFDCSRLRTRGILSRLDPGVLDRPQLDLMHPARRIATNWLPDCRLKSLEQCLLGREREDDLAGSEVPGVYRSWLSEGFQPDLPRVLEHNRYDVENLMHLAAMLAAIYSDGEDPLELPPSAHHRLGRTLLARKRLKAARTRFERAMNEGEGTIACRAAFELARLHKRSGDWKIAEEIYRHCVQRWPRWIPAKIELAKIQEHRRKDPAAALNTVMVALEVLAKLPSAERDEVFVATVDALEYRRQRLSRRICKVALS